ncbi:hypothetical protein [Amycolatopsis magusensis]|uniref:hypothetical protein n=1 Tax=Amycolatopsis magusensis TaxID=882444 RepID=UPI0037BA067D
MLDEAGLSNAALARAVVHAGAEEGIHLGTSTSSVRRMLAGAQPRWPVPRLVATVLSRHLHREISVATCGFVDQLPVADDRHDALQSAGTVDETVRTVVELSERDMDRRKFLLGSAFSAAAFSEPALAALTTPPAQSTARVGGQRIGMADVEILQQNLTHLRHLDHRYGAGRVREQVVQLVHREAGKVLHGSYSQKTGTALLGAVAQASWLAGSMSADIGRHALAQRYYIQTLNLAMQAGDRAYAANVLSHMSRLTVQIGHSATAEHHRARHARHAIALARAGRGVARDSATPVLSALLHAVEARGLALLGDAHSTRTTVLKAERHFHRAGGDEPGWLSFYTDAELAADLGRCLRDAGELQEGTRLIQQALDSYEPWRARSRCFVQTDLATAHLIGGDFEQAAAFGRDAVRSTRQVHSLRARERLRTLQRQIRPLRSASRPLADLDHRVTGLLAPHRRSRTEDTIA